jgi:hypothetical protein
MLCFRAWKMVGLIVLVASLSASPARAGVLWYNGDNNNISSLLNESKVPINNGLGASFQTALVYENFVVPVGQTWTVTSVFSDDQMAYYQSATKATWQIRSGVSAGNGGMLIASGDTAATQTALTPVTGYTYNLTEYQVTATVPSVVLTAGQYWLAVAPDSAGYYGDQSYVETTSGANSVGTPGGNDGNSYTSLTYPTMVSFLPTSSILTGIGNVDFSMGVAGTFISVPEPSSLILLTVGLVGSAALLRRRSPTRSQVG